MIRIKTIEIAALGISLCATLFVGIFEIAAWTSAWHFIVLLTAVFLSVFFMSRFLINRFVMFKIKPIYQIIHARNISTREMEKELSGHEDVVEGIRDELTEWADLKAQEISRLKDNERYRKEFLGNVAHEIKTPVFTIQGYILTLLDGAIDEEQINRLYLERTEKNIDRLIHIVQDLDEISKLECGEIILKRSHFDLKGLVREMSETLEFDAEKRRITIKTEPNGLNPIPVYADRDRVGQVLVNLLSNSIKYGREGGTTTVRFIDMFDKVMVEVQDDGIGIDREHHPRIFERFYRVDKSRSRDQGGTGLGLAIVKHTLEAHQEQITVRSEVGTGTTFAFSLAKSPVVR